jgi:sulfur-carrier protein
LFSGDGHEATMEVTLKYFAWVRERVGTGEERVTLPASLATVGDVVEWLKQRGDGYAAAFEREGLVRAAIDHVHARRDASLDGAREIAFFPPVTGG